MKLTKKLFLSLILTNATIASIAIPVTLSTSCSQQQQKEEVEEKEEININWTFRQIKTSSIIGGFFVDRIENVIKIKSYSFMGKIYFFNQNQEPTISRSMINYLTSLENEGKMKFTMYNATKDTLAEFYSKYGPIINKH